MAKKRKKRAAVHKLSFFWKLIITLCLIAAIFSAVMIYLQWPANDGAPDNPETSAVETPAPEAEESPTPEPTPEPTPAPAPARQTSAPAQQTPMPADAIAFNSQWPEERFSIVPPPFEEGAYSVAYDSPYSARVVLPPGSADRFNEYKEALVGAGASLLAENANATALAMESVEIQLIHDPSVPAIVLYDEPELPPPPAIEGFPLPENGRLVNVSGSLGDVSGAALTYRCASFADVTDYVEILEIESWSAVDKTNTDDNALYAEYRQGERAIVIDYRFTTADLIIYCKNIEDE